MHVHTSVRIAQHKLPGQQRTINLSKLALLDVQVVPASPKGIVPDFQQLTLCKYFVRLCIVQMHVLHLRRHMCQRCRTSPSVCPLPSSTVITLLMK